ncbi:hypothetical protein KR044_006652 [Drosophila immigrans]|nr:hypothetical protein KR044_006652 [Drosophila immigrans]
MADSRKVDAVSAKNVIVLRRDVWSVRDLLVWLNGEMKCKVVNISDLRTGAVYCQMMHRLYPDVMPLMSVKLYTRKENDFEHNFALLTEAFKTLNITIDLPSMRLINGFGHADFLNWYHKFYEANVTGVAPYRPRLERHNSKIGLKPGLPLKSTTAETASKCGYNFGECFRRATEKPDDEFADTQDDGAASEAAKKGFRFVKHCTFADDSKIAKQVNVSENNDALDNDSNMSFASLDRDAAVSKKTADGTISYIDAAKKVFVVGDEPKTVKPLLKTTSEKSKVLLKESTFLFVCKDADGKTKVIQLEQENKNVPTLVEARDSLFCELDKLNKPMDMNNNEAAASDGKKTLLVKEVNNNDRIDGAGDNKIVIQVCARIGEKIIVSIEGSDGVDTLMGKCDSLKTDIGDFNADKKNIIVEDFKQINDDMAINNLKLDGTKQKYEATIETDAVEGGQDMQNGHKKDEPEALDDSVDDYLEYYEDNAHKKKQDELKKAADVLAKLRQKNINYHKILNRVFDVVVEENDDGKNQIMELREFFKNLHS